jgi:predicted dehydrogenase
VHHVSALRLIVGEIAEVSAVVIQNLPELGPADTLSATLRFDNGVLGAYLATHAIAAPWPAYLYIAGDKGALRVQRREIEVIANGETRRIQCEGFNGVEKELVAFAESIRAGKPHLNTPEQALQDLAVMEAILHAAESGGKVAPQRFV